MTRSILGLHEVRAHDAAFAGGKAANLGELLGKGFPVPAGFVVSSSAYVRFLERLDMEGELRGMGDAPRSELSQRCASVRARIEATDLPPALSAEILAAHARLTGTRGPDVLCAVRSSATAEDLGAASFAGQHSTYYYVDAPHLLPMIRKCWASLWSPEAVSYRATHGIDGASVHMAVVVQEMIPSDISGVAFTANPVTGVRSELIIESSWGMGAAIVDGRVTPDRYIVEREGLRLRERRISDKRFMVASHLETGRDARLSEVPHAMRRRETLSAEQVQTVAEWSLRSEAHFGKPQDVEWAISQGRFHMLQSRPITVMGREEVGLGVKGKYVLFKPIVENFTDPLTPFSTDMLLMVRPPGLRFIRGWIYVDVEFLRRLLPFSVTDEDLARHAYSFSREPPALRFSPGKALA
ncbi:MAG TPA: PEP/pyruvate-binding domain-containing protein, partial [Vicinamibacteria bacterium]|nr:PEP/pyruvate-binding domain-containing protein [Vicinamibacteria bacterium]